MWGEDGSCGDSRPRLSSRAKLDGFRVTADAMLEDEPRYTSLLKWPTRHRPGSLELGGGMKRLVLTLILAPLVFSLGVIADGTIRPDGWWWQKLSPIRQLGYVEGFVAGEMESSEEHGSKPFCKDAAKDPAHWQPVFVDCILSQLEGDTLQPTDVNKTLDVMVKFYQSPQNMPVSWGHALIISQAMLSGLPVSDKDLEAIRKHDATPPQPMTPLEEQKLRDFIKNNPPKK